MIYFVRHGQTDDNANGNLLTGWSAHRLMRKDLHKLVRPLNAKVMEIEI